MTGYINELYEIARLPADISTSFVTLVQKKVNPQYLNEYHPISLIRSFYKILVKLLASRLKRALGGVISECHNAFLPGRPILDRFLVINELLDYAKISKKKCLVLKVD